MELRNNIYIYTSLACNLCDKPSKHIDNSQYFFEGMALEK